MDEDFKGSNFSFSPRNDNLVENISQDVFNQNEVRRLNFEVNNLRNQLDITLQENNNLKLTIDDLEVHNLSQFNHIKFIEENKNYSELTFSQREQNMKTQLNKSISEKGYLEQKIANVENEGYIKVRNIELLQQKNNNLQKDVISKSEELRALQVEKQASQAINKQNIRDYEGFFDYLHFQLIRIERALNSPSNAQAEFKIKGAYNMETFVDRINQVEQKVKIKNENSENPTLRIKIMEEEISKLKVENYQLRNKGKTKDISKELKVVNELATDFKNLEQKVKTAHKNLTKSSYKKNLTGQKVKMKGLTTAGFRMKNNTRALSP